MNYEPNKVRGSIYYYERLHRVPVIVSSPSSKDYDGIGNGGDVR